MILKQCFSFILLSLLQVNEAFVAPHQRYQAVQSFSLPTTTITTIPYQFSRKTLLCNSRSEVDNIQRPENEFSRSVNVDAVLGVRRNSIRDYYFSVEAKTEELNALAERFHLPNIAKLTSDLTIKSDSPSRRRTGASGSSDDTIYVEGSISATLTQTCVRTNDDFEVDLEFDFFAAVRSIGALDRENLNSAIRGMEVSKSSNYKSREGKVSRKQRNTKQKNTRQTRNMDDMGLMELQNLMEDVDYYEDETNDVIEDDAVYQNGILDAGELVSQMFRLKLDPYPRKPGSEPVKFSITG